MKRKIISLAIGLCVFAFVTRAQVPQGIKYQAIARAGDGKVLASQQISVRLGIIDSALGGINVYMEFHKLGTNEHGLFSFVIGQGLTPVGSFSNIVWSTGNKWVRIEMDPAGGSNYYLMGISELVTVPYAFYAGSAASSNEFITDVTYSPADDELKITENTSTHTTTIVEEKDDLSDNDLNDLSDVNVTPAAGQVLKWDGSNWVSGNDETNDQNLAIIGNVLSITDGNSINLSPYLDNTDDQVISFNPATNILSLEDGGTVDLSNLAIGAYNTGLSFNPATRQLTVTDGGSSLSVNIPDNVNDADANPANELITGASLNGNTLQINEGGNTTSVDLSTLADADSNPANELQTLSLTGTTLGISSGNNVDLSVLQDGVNDADADPTNELQTISKTGNIVTLSNGGGSFIDAVNDADADPANELQTISKTGNIVTLSNGGGLFLDEVNDADADPTNELLGGATLNGTVLVLVDGGGVTAVDLSALVNDADANPTNELQDLSLTGNTLSLSSDATPVDLTGYINTDNQNLSSSVNGTTVTLGITGGTGTSFNIADNDNDPANEMQTLSLNGSDISISGGNTITLPPDGDSNPTNELQDLSLSGNTLSLSSDATPVNLLPYLDNTDAQNLSLNGNSLSIQNGNSVDLSSFDDVDTDDQNLGLVGNTLSIQDGNSVDLSIVNTDNQDLNITGNVLTLTNDGTPVDLTGFLDNTDNQSLSINGSNLSISNGNTIALPPDGDSNPTNELQDLSLSGNTLTLSSDATPVDLSGFLDDTDTDDQSLSLVGNTLSIQDGNSVDLSSYTNTDNQDLSIAGNILSLTNDGTPVDLSGYLDDTDTDDQSLLLNGNLLSIEDGNAVDLSGFINADTDDQNLSLVGNTLSIQDGNSVDLSSYNDNTDNQTLNFAGGTLSITGGNSVAIPDLVDDADANPTNELQDLSLFSNTLSLTNDATPVDLSGYLDNTDAQSLSLNGNLLSIQNANSVDLSGFINADTDDQNLSLVGNTLSIQDGNSVDLSSYNDNTDNQTLNFAGGVLSISGGNAVPIPDLVDDADANPTNEIQDLSLSGNTLSLTSDATPVDLSGFMDDTDTDDQTLLLNGNLLSIDDGNTVDLSGFINADTDDQNLSLVGNTLSIQDGNSVDLSGYTNTDNQDLSLTGNVLSLTNDGTPVNLSPYLDNTDNQSLSFAGGTLSIAGGNSVPIPDLVDDADANPTNEIQDLSLSGNTLTLSNDATPVDLSGFLADTDDQNLSLVGNTLSIQDGNSVDLSSYNDNTDNQTLSFAGGTLSIAGGNSVPIPDLVDDADANPTNEIQDLSLSGSTLTLSSDATPVDLSGFLADTDDQNLSLVGNTLSIQDGNSVDLSSYNDNTDNQTLNFVGGVLSISGGNAVPIPDLVDDADANPTNELQDLSLSGSTLTLSNDATPVDLSGFLADTDDQNLSLVGNTLSIQDGNSVDLSGYTNTDNQDLSLAGNVLSLTNDGTPVNLSPYLDNTDNQDMSLAANVLSLTNDASPVNLSPYLDNTDNQTLSFVGGTLSIAGGNSVPIPDLVDDADANPTNELQDLSLSGNTLTLSSDATPVDLSGYLDDTDTDDQTLVLNGNLLSIDDGNTVDLGGFINADTDDQNLSLVGNTLSIQDGNSVDLSGYTNTDNQDLSLTGNVLSLTNDGTPVNLSPYLDNTDNQDMSLAANILSLTNDGSPVNLSPYLDNTDNQTLSFVGGTLSIAGGNSVPIPDLVDDADANPINEIQDLSLSGNTLTLSSDATPVDLSGFLLDTDDQNLSVVGNTLSIQDGNSVDLTPFKDNTDNQDLALVSNTLSLTNDATSVNLSPYLDNTDNQTLSFVGGTLSIAGGNAVPIPDLVDDADANPTNEIQDLSLSGNTLTLSSDATPVDLSGFLADTDDQNLSLVGNTLSIQDGNSVDLSSYNDNTDNQTLNFVGGVLSISGGNAVPIPDLVDDADANPTNELQDLSLSGNTLTLSSDATPVDLSGYLDDTDTDDQNLSLIANTLSIESGNSVDLSGYVNTDNQNLSIAGNILSLTNDGTPVDLSGYLDDTDTDDQTLLLNGNLLSIDDGNSVDLSGFINSDTDDQNLSLVGNTLSIQDGNSVDLSSYNDNTDNQTLNFVGGVLSISGGNAVPIPDLVDDADANPTNEIQDLSLSGNTLTLSSDATPVDLSGYLDDTDTDDQDLALVSNTLSIEDGNSVNLSPYLDNTDNQDLILSGNILSVTGDASTVDLSSFLDDTDDQILFLNGTLLSIQDGNSVNLSAIADGDWYFNGTNIYNGNPDNVGIGTNLPTAKLDVNGTFRLRSLSASAENNVLVIDGSGNVTTRNLGSDIWDGDDVDDLDVDPTNELQDLSLAGNTLSLTADGTPVDLSGYLDDTDTDNQNLNLAGSILSIEDGNFVNLSAFTNTDNQDLQLIANVLSLTNDASPVDLSPYLDNTDNQDLNLSGNILSLSGDFSPVDLSGYVNTDNQDLTLTANVLSLTNDGTPVNLAAYLDNTDAQDLTLSGNTLSLTGDGTSVNLSAYLDNTDNQDLNLSGNTLSLTNDGSTVNLAPYLDNTDAQTLSINASGTIIISGSLSSVTEVDPQVGSNTTDRVPRWNGTALTTGTVYDDAVNVGIGIAPNSSYRLYVNGKIRTNGVNETSDARLKKDVQTLQNALDKVLALRGVSYNWRTDEFPDLKLDDAHQIGLIAQEVEAIIPEIVSTDAEGYKSVQYAHLVALLIEAIKDLKTEMNSKDALIQSLSGELKDFKSGSDVKFMELEAKIKAVYTLLELESKK